MIATKGQKPGGMVAVGIRCNRTKRFAKSANRKTGNDVVDHRHVFKQTGRLIGARNAITRSKIGGFASDVLIPDAHHTFGRFVKPADDVQKRGFTRAVRADDGCDIARLGGKGNGIDRLHPAKGDGQVFNHQTIGLGVIL